MSKYRSQLPQLSKDPFITDGGIKTTQRSFSWTASICRNFAAFVLLDSDPGTKALANYFRQYADLAWLFREALARMPLICATHSFRLSAHAENASDAHSLPCNRRELPGSLR